MFIKRISKCHPPQIDFEKLKKIREEIFKIQEQARRERELNRIIDKLINLQEEAGRQIRRLVIAQGFIDDNYK